MNTENTDFCRNEMPQPSPLRISVVFAAWLQGTEGEGVADVLFGDYPFTGKLPVTWPRLMEQLPFDFDALPAAGPDAPLFPRGFGLTTTGE